jgi:hypothetical protein
MIFARWGRFAGASACLLLPGAAHAECLSSGCYDGVAWLLGGAILVCILAVVAIVLMVMRRWRMAMIVGGTILATVVVVALQI